MASHCCCSFRLAKGHLQVFQSDVTIPDARVRFSLRPRILQSRNSRPSHRKPHWAHAPQTLCRRLGIDTSGPRSSCSTFSRHGGSREHAVLSPTGRDTAIWRLADRLSHLADCPVGDVRTGLCITGLHTARDLARDMLHPMSKDRARMRGKPASESCGCCPQPRN